MKAMLKILRRGAPPATPARVPEYWARTHAGRAGTPDSWVPAGQGGAPDRWVHALPGLEHLAVDDRFERRVDGPTSTIGLWGDPERPIWLVTEPVFKPYCEYDPAGTLVAGRIAEVLPPSEWLGDQGEEVFRILRTVRALDHTLRAPDELVALQPARGWIPTGLQSWLYSFVDEQLHPAVARHAEIVSPGSVRYGDDGRLGCIGVAATDWSIVTRAARVAVMSLFGWPPLTPDDRRVLDWWDELSANQPRAATPWGPFPHRRGRSRTRYLERIAQDLVNRTVAYYDGFPPVGGPYASLVPVHSGARGPGNLDRLIASGGPVQLPDPNRLYRVTQWVEEFHFFFVESAEDDPSARYTVYNDGAGEEYATGPIYIPDHYALVHPGEPVLRDIERLAALMADLALLRAASTR